MNKIKIEYKFQRRNNTTENNMDMIPQFQTLPEDLVDNILMMTPWEGQRENHQNCMAQLLNMRDCLQYYQAGGIWTNGARWQRWSYMRFALFKARQKRELNRER